MNSIKAVLRDRRRSQRGSVLSGVLIITAFVAIIAGALMTELSTNFLLSHNLMTRITNQATVDSALELTLSNLGTAPISKGCPAPVLANVNGRTAVTAYVECEPVVDSSSPQFIRITPRTGFGVDGTHVILPALGVNEYIVGDSAGTVHQFGFGQTFGWTVALGGKVTSPPLEMAAPSDSPDGEDSILVPVDSPTAPGYACASAQGCVALLSGYAGSRPSLRCFMSATSTVSAAPAQGVSYPDLAFLGDANGNVFAYDATEDGGCAQQAVAPWADGPRAVVAGPIVFPGPLMGKTPSDAIFTVRSDSGSSELVEYTYSVGKSGPVLVETGGLPLPAPSAQGVAVEKGSLPARLAITFASGMVAVVQIQPDFSKSVVATANLRTPISDSPSWCHCGGATDLIAAGGEDGSVHLLDTSLKPVATLPAGGPAISTTPQSDGVGDWFFGAGDGYLYEAQQDGSRSTMTVVAQFGQFSAPVGSAVQVGACAAGLCAYLGSLTGAAYTIQLDARDAVLTTCLSTAPPGCSSDNPRLWASVEVGAAGSPQTVHVEGWSYYSP